MSIFGKVVKGAVELAATGADLVITKTSQVIENKFGEKEIIKTASEIGSGTVRVTETTVKTMTDVVDGGIEAGLGYLSNDEERKINGLEQTKTAGKELVTGIGKGIAYTATAGVKTALSAVTAGKYFVNGEKDMARQELDHTKDCAKHLGKTVAVGLLAFGPMVENTVEEETTDKSSLNQAAKVTDKPNEETD